MNYIPPLPTNAVGRYADGSPARAAHRFPPNYAASAGQEVLKQIWLWMSQKYVFPQVQERTHFEDMWDKMLRMARVQLPEDEMFPGSEGEGTRLRDDLEDKNTGKAKVSDTVVHDAIERLTDITHFISFKDKLPIQYGLPEYMESAMDTHVYQPLKKRIKAGNALLQWNSDNMDVYRNHLINTRHHFTYGISFILSDFRFRVEAINRQMNDGSIQPVPEITELGTTFEPISIRKMWLNWRLPVYSMKAQPCPFFYTLTPRFAIMQNTYHPTTNPFGFVNQDLLQQDTYLFQESEFASAKSAFDITHTMMDYRAGGSRTASLLEPKHSVEAKWTFYPMLPYDEKTNTFDSDGKLGIPYRRFVVETFGPNIHSGGQQIIRLQPDYYPRNELPVYGTCHMPDLDSGAYPPSIGQILYNHYRELTKCMGQFLDNKDQINNAPAWVQNSSPAREVDLNKPGAKILVNGPNDFGWKPPYDATHTTVQMMQYLRDGAQTTSKAVDAILGKAMGSRTSATEASNAFQASMSGITTDINLYNYDAMGGYANRHWQYCGLWIDADLLKAITGQFGFEILPEDMHMSISLKWDVASTYIERITKQQNIRYVLEAGRMDPMLNRDEFWRMLLTEMGFDPAGLIADNGREQQIQLATMQSAKTYYGEPVMVDPSQDHQIAIEVKSAFIKDLESSWNQKFGFNAPRLIEQIQVHEQFLLLQQQQQLAMMQMQAAQAQLGIAQEEESRQQNSPQKDVSTKSSEARPPAQMQGQAA